MYLSIRSSASKLAPALLRGNGSMRRFAILIHLILRLTFNSLLFYHKFFFLVFFATKDNSINRIGKYPLGRRLT